jgi:tetratricopeptide (TPR) repeat protein
MSSKPFQRKDLKHDQFVIGAGRVGHWLMERRRRIGWAVLAVAVVLSVIFSVRFAHQRQEQQAAALLAAAMEVYRAPVIPPTPEPVATPVADAGGEGEEGAAEGAAGAETTGVEGAAGTETTGAEGVEAAAGEGTEAAGSEGAADTGEGDEAPLPEPAPVPQPEYTGLQFATLQEKNNAAIERFEPIVERYGGRPSGRLAAYYLGICQSELGNTDAAITALQQAADASEPLISSMALFRLGQLQLGAGNAEAAIEHFDRLLERDDALFPQEEALMAKARAHEDSGDPRSALAAYQRVLNEHAGTSAAAEARARAEELSAQLGVALQEPGAPSS